MLNHAFHDIASYNCISSYPIISLWTNFNISLWFLVVSSTFPASLSPLSIQTSPASPVPPWGDGASSSGACALAKLGAGFFFFGSPQTQWPEKWWIDVNWCELWRFFVKSVFHALSFKTRHQVEVTWIPFDFEHPRWISESLFGAAKSCSHHIVCIIRFLQRSEHRPEQTDSPKVLD